jgi:serine/threonine protein kinase
MALAIGSRVGPYQITAEIGAGGMGVVYRAHDSRLGRDVAVKVSAERFSERFEREARAVAALNHPNICTLYDVGPDYLVMELVEGETLADVLAGRPRSSPGLPLDETLRIARQIASALDAAHDAGIVHRDLKPGNIKVKDEGSVKVLDFGLAKINGPSEPAGSGVDKLTHSPTLLATQAGLILGTAAYMSPEQARGKAVDKRADIWAFGVVVYEMLTGRRPFDGEDASTTVAAVIQSEPRWDGVPPSMLRLLKRCLTKDPRRRLRDIGDVWDLLDTAQSVTPLASSRVALTGWIAAAVMAVLAIVALWAPWRVAPSIDQPFTQLEINLGDNISLPPLVAPTPSTIAISPDGTRLAYVASIVGGTPKLVVRRLDTTEGVELTGTEGGLNPFFSPDGEWVFFWDTNRVKKVSVTGGAVVPVGESQVFAGATWISNSEMLIGSGLKQGLLKVPVDGGAATAVVTPNGDELFFAVPSVLPGGRHVLVTIYGTPPGPDRAVIEVIGLEDKRRKTIARGVTAARYLPSGHLIYTNRSTMFAVPFDLDTLAPRGAAVPVLNDIAFDTAAGLPQFDVSRNGTLVYRGSTSSGGGLATMTWLDSSGKSQPLLGKSIPYSGGPRVSPDGNRIALILRDGGNQDVWIYDIARDGLTRLTFGTETFVAPIWSRDGRHVIFGSIGNGLYWARSDGAGQPQPLLATKTIAFPFSLSPDGKRLAYVETIGKNQIWTVSIDQGDGLKAGMPEQFLSSQFADTTPMISPDGRWLAYESNEGGQNEVYVRPLIGATAGSGKWQISTKGGQAPLWSPDGREILYRSGDQVIAVGYTTRGDSFVADKPRIWLDGLRGAVAMDLAPDGKRLAVVTAAAQGEQRPEHTVMLKQNFFDELRRRVPLRK